MIKNADREAIMAQPVKIDIHWLAEVIILCFFFLFISYVYKYGYQLGGPRPMLLYLAFIGINGLLITLMNLRPALPQQFPATPLLLAFFGWFIAYIIYLIFHVQFSNYPDLASERLIAGVEMALLAISATWAFVVFGLIRGVMWCMVLAAILAVSMNIWDFLYHDFSKVGGRAAGLYVNPTIAGKMLALLMVGSLPVLPRSLRLPFVMFCALGVLLTFSRGAWVLWLVGFIWFISLNRNPGTPFLSAKAIAALATGLVLGLLLFSGAVGQLIDGTPAEALLTDNTKARIGLGSEVVSGYSKEERESLILYSLNAWVESPLFGKGVSYTEVWRQAQRPHNMYMIFLVEGGLVGLSLYLVLLILLWTSAEGAGKALVMILIVSGLFTHSNLEQPAVMMLLAFIVAQGFSARHIPEPEK